MKLNWHQKHENQLSLSDRLAIKINKTVGSMPFIIISTVVIIAWITLNVVAIVHHWDPYPFILLNLAFSAFAFYASPLILMAGNIAAARDKIAAEHQFTHQEQELQIQTKILLEQSEILEELRKR